MDANASEQSQGKGPGATLRQAREAQGWAPERLATELHLNAELIHALEADDYAALPEPPYVRGYLRTAARLLDLDEAALLKAYEGSRPPTPEPEPRPQLRSRPTRSPMGYWVVLAVPVIAVVVWVIASPGSGVPQFPVEPEPAVEVPEPPPLPPVESLSPAEPLTPPLPELPIAQGESGTPDASAEAAGEPGPVATPAVPTEPVAEEAAQEAPGPGTGIALLPASGDDLLRMRFLEASWVEVLDADERQLYYGLVEPGSIQEVRGRAPFDLRLGNAPGVEVEMNGNEVDLAPRTRSDNTARLRLQ